MNKTNWIMDPAHSEIVFKVRHMMITNVSGTFNQFSGKVLSSKDDFTDAEISFEADLNSVSTRNEQRDEHLKSPDFFDVANFPSLSFTGKELKKLGGNEYELIGELSLHKEKRMISLDAEFMGVAIDPWGQVKAGFEITGSLDRFDYGLNWNLTAEDGTVVVDKTIKLAINAQFIKQI
jgi:polyisoprenoid-binding protein YceI